jgi:autoinducer 2-degrading protein
MKPKQRPDGRYAIIVEFDLHPDAYEEFMDHLAENAETSVRNEPGCYRFDVLTPREGDPARVTLYEIYTDRSAFDDHLRTPHFLAFKEAVGNLVRRQSLIEFDVSENAKAA